MKPQLVRLQLTNSFTQLITCDLIEAINLRLIILVDFEPRPEGLKTLNQRLFISQQKSYNCILLSIGLSNKVYASNVHDCNY